VLLVGVDEVNCWRQIILKTSMVTMVTKGAVAVEGLPAPSFSIRFFERA
jgi:hypothetical protein